MVQESVRAGAHILQNFVPLTNSIQARKGYVIVDTVVGAVESLMSFNDGASADLLAAANDKIYTVPTSVAPTTLSATEIGSGFSNARWQHVVMSNAADVVAMLMVNGADGMWRWDGTALTEVAYTGPGPTLSNIVTHNARIWCSEKGSATLWYGEPLSNEPVNMIPFPVGPILRKGGEIVGINTLTHDGGAGPDDYLVITTDEGEIVLFNGIDPATDFSLVGLYNTSKILGYRCLKKWGPDLVIFSEHGPQQLTSLLPNFGGQGRMGNPIRTEFEKAIVVSADSFGWDIQGYSRHSWTLYNIPILAPSRYDQYVKNEDTGAWFKITNWNGICWEEHEKQLFFGDALGNICLADFGQSDNGMAIQCDYASVWDNYGSADNKQFNMCEITVKSDVKPDVLIDMMTDYRLETPTNTPGYPGQAASSPWNTSPWDISPWSGTTVNYILTSSLSGIGYVGAIRYRVQVKDIQHEFYGFRVSYELGSTL